MTNKEAEDRANKLGLSAWVVQAVVVGPQSHTVDLMCVGFASIDFPLAEAESWEEAFLHVEKTIFRV
ncbi:MAG TPA: hypothetical protein VFT97_08210 [Candidatus Eisenbacteria bacterium]|jgi:hypothetical protein|nr:hypothetical protein [Candidatus Eisenbacteria bacterium]